MINTSHSFFYSKLFLTILLTFYNCLWYNICKIKINGDAMNLKEILFNTLSDMEKVVVAFNIKPFEIYFLGGSACVMGGYTKRATRDFDFIDLHYDMFLGNAFAILRDYDMLEYESTPLSPDYKERAAKLSNYSAFNAYLLSPEDIVVSKIIRLAPKDLDDIDNLIKICDKNLINTIINNVLGRNDLYQSKKELFCNNLKVFREKYNV
jgi:hypothetical protein